MKTLLEFLKSTLMGGFFILLPLLLFGLLLGEILEAIIGLATPIAELFPQSWFENVQAPVAVAIILIVLVSMLFGLAMRLVAARQLGHWLEDNTIGRLPLYSAIKSLASRFASLEEDGKFKPALIHGPADQREFAYLMEDLGNGYASVMLPRSPTPMAGSIKVVPMTQVEVLDVSLGELSAVISHWGVGSKELLVKSG
ncbi:MAG: hypothetical protein WBP44_01090 [Gammaproteobacteria bacterium]